MPQALIILLAIIVAIPILVVAVVFLVIPVVKGISLVVRQIVRFIGGILGDTLRLVGAIFTSIAFAPLVIANLVIGRWSACAHFGRALRSELTTASKCCYRIFVGHPARLFGLGAALEGIERRVPEAIAASPGADKPKGRHRQFEGYAIVGSLPVGGSGARLYIAQPDEIRLAGFERAGQRGVDKVVIKSFSVQEGSTLPQIVRESQALQAARRLGLILDHEIASDHFYYVMRYVPGDSLGLVTQRLHGGAPAGLAGGDGLDDAGLRTVLGYARDLLRSLGEYHAGGLWHKDVKPDNIIVHDGRAHLVDFGLITPLRSNMTLTTHGTEYFRDPELVRLALRGVKVSEVDGARFDVYAAGAVLFSMIENSFPAHSGLSRLSRRCPEALKWIVRRAMTDYDKRYPTAGAMLADIEALLRSDNLFGFAPGKLPSVVADMQGGGKGSGTPVGAAHGGVGDGIDDGDVGSFGVGRVSRGGWNGGVGAVPGAAPGAGSGKFGGGVGAGFGADAGSGAGSGARVDRRGGPMIRVTDWWSGRYAFREPAGVERVGVAGADGKTKGGGVGGRAVVDDRAHDVVGVAAAGAALHRMFEDEGVLEDGGFAGRRCVVPRGKRLSASEQLANARSRVAAAQERARGRKSGLKARKQVDPRAVNSGVVAAVLMVVGGVVLAVLVAGGFMVFSAREVEGESSVVWESGTGTEMRAARDATYVGTSREGAPVLVIRRDVPLGDPVLRSKTGLAAGRLADRGLVPFGDVTGDQPDASLLGSSGLSAEDLLATALVEVGTRVVPSDDAGQAIGRWLSKHPEIAGVAWFLPDASSREGYMVWVVTGPNDARREGDVESGTDVAGVPSLAEVVTSGAYQREGALLPAGRDRDDVVVEVLPSGVTVEAAALDAGATGAGVTVRREGSEGSGSRVRVNRRGSE